MGQVQMRTGILVGGTKAKFLSVTKLCSVFWFLCFHWSCCADNIGSSKLIYHRQHLIHERSATVTIERTTKPVLFPEHRSEDNYIDTGSNLNGDSSNESLIARRRLFSGSGGSSGSQNNFSSGSGHRNKFYFPQTGSNRQSQSVLGQSGREFRDETSLRPIVHLSPARPSGSIRFPGSSSSGRTGRDIELNNKTKSGDNSNKKAPISPGPAVTLSSTELSSSSASQEKESSRKASPDVQDIIDGIVKLLGGKVHNPQVQLQSQSQQNNQHQQQTSYQPVHPLPPPQSPPKSQNPAYNLFNPTKPVFFQTGKPSRINNRGPPLPGNSPNQQISGDRNQNSFEAIPLEALNSDFNLNQTRFGPPFPLGQIPGVEAPYKQGVPLPEQLVPQSHSYSKYGSPPTQHNGDTGSNNQNNQHYAPFGSRDPYLDKLSQQNTGFSQGSKYQDGNDHGSNNSPSPPSSTEIVPNEKDTTTTSSGQNGHSSGSGKKLTTTSLLVPVTEKSTNSNKGYSPSGSPRPQVSLTSPEAPVVVTLPEDDEEDDLRFTTSVNSNLDKKFTLLGSEQPSVNLEPTISEDFLIPTLENHPPVSSHDPGTSLETVFDFSELPSNTRKYSSSKDPRASSVLKSQLEKIKPTAATAPTSVYPTLVLETNGNNGLEIVTRSTITSTFTSTNVPVLNPQQNHRPPLIYPNSKLHQQVQEFNAKTGGTTTSTSTTHNPVTSLATTSGATPPLRPGIVFNDGPAGIRGGGNQGYGSVEVVSAADGGHHGQVGEVFDVTVTAQQNYGGKVTGQPFITPVDLKDEGIITQAKGNEQFVSIDGKRTYFNLHPNTASGIASVTQTVGNIPPVVSNKPAPPSLTTGVGTVGAPVPVLQPGKFSNKGPFGVVSSGGGHAPGRPVSTSLSISGGSGGINTGGIINTGNKTPPNIVRRPLTRRPSVPPVRIDTCIVGDDSTCNAEQFEACRTESGVSSCVCRAGYARRRHREPCKAIVSLVLSIKLDKLGDKKLSYNPDYFNPNSELYQSLEWETIHALDSSMSETTLSLGYVGSKLDAVGFDGRHAVVNATVLITENPKLPVNQVQRELKKQIIHVLTKHRNNFGNSQLWVEGPISAVSAVTDLNECENPDLIDCDSKAKCINTYGSFECKCDPGYGDSFEKDKRRSGRKCDSCSSKAHCNGRGDCLIENGQKYCKCSGNYYGSQCDIDGEVLAVAIGASVSAVVIIGLTLACLCMWSRRWKKEEQKAALMSRTLFGGMASQALSYLSKNTMSSSNPYQQHVTMDERLRWAQVADTNLNGNIYVQNEPLSLHASPPLMGSSMMETPPMMSARRSADTIDTTVDDIFDERQVKRPRSRSSQMQGGIYYDLEPESGGAEMYSSRPMVPFPAQFCVPMSPMNHFTHTNRGFYN